MRRAALSLALAVFAALGVSPATKKTETADKPRPPQRLMPIGGEPRKVLVRDGDTLLDVAFDYRLGFEAVERLNPGVDPWIPVAGTVIDLPTQYVLPDVEPKGLVINVPEMRLYDFTVTPMEVFAAAIGDEADPSLHGEYKVGAKRKNPAWYVPASIKAEKPDLPAVVPAGPDNPLGSRWMTIGNTSYGIHGTNKQWSIGRMATHGCVRLYDDQIKKLYDRTPTGTRLQLLYQPYKWGIDGNDLYLEVHPDLYGRYPGPLTEALRTPRELGILRHIDLELAWRAVEEARGVPVWVGRLPEPPPTLPVTSRPTS
ncbi:MAG TPA: L,D-transpeptidase family protein [Myxococcota bacterium]|nr:L,D-transpeptidase family protein [Myxococcota bacterium]